MQEKKERGPILCAGVLCLGDSLEPQGSTANTLSWAHLFTRPQRSGVYVNERGRCMSIHTRSVHVGGWGALDVPVHTRGSATVIPRILI